MVGFFVVVVCCLVVFGGFFLMRQGIAGLRGSKTGFYFLYLI